MEWFSVKKTHICQNMKHQESYEQKFITNMHFFHRLASKSPTVPNVSVKDNKVYNIDTFTQK